MLLTPSALLMMMQTSAMTVLASALNETASARLRVWRLLRRVTPPHSPALPGVATPAASDPPTQQIVPMTAKPLL
jgi:hypothetical protein